MKKLFKWIVVVFIIVVIFGIIFGDDATEQTPVESKVALVTEEPLENQTDAANSEQIEVSTDEILEQPVGLTRPQNNAVRSAKQYLSMTGFSRDGLIEQLSSSAGDGYDVADATIAVDSLNTDWNEQAVRSAKEYLNMMGFSCDGLVEQLSSSAGSKYTVSEAKYGAQQAGACS